VAGIESEVLKTFLAALAYADDVPQHVTKSLARMLAADGLPNPDQLVALYAEASGESALRSRENMLRDFDELLAYERIACHHGVLRAQGSPTAHLLGSYETVLRHPI